MKPITDKYYIAMSPRSFGYRAGETYFEEVKGKPVKIEGYDDFDFFVSGSRGNWTVSEGVTGRYIGFDSFVGCHTQKEAIANAKERLDTDTGGDVEVIRKKIDGRERTSPRYGDE